VTTRRALKVLFVTHAFPRTAGDGAGAFVLALAKALAAEGVTVDVLAPSAPGLAAEDVIEEVRVRRYRYAPAAWETLAYLGTFAEQVAASLRGKLSLLLMLRSGRRAVRAQLRAGNYDLVHAHWWFPNGLMSAGLSIPMIVTSHGSDVRLARGALARRLCARVSAKAAAWTAVSGWLAHEASEILDGRPVETAPMPAATSIFGPAAGATRTVDRMLFVGRLNAQKRIGDLLDALAQSSRSWSLDVIGDGPDGDALARRAATLGVATRVRWHGQLPQAALAPFYRAAAAVVIPSIDEGLGLVGVEAALCEAPVIAYASGGLTDVVQDGTTGWLVPAGDLAALTHAIDGVVDRPQNARAFGLAGRAFALAHFSPEAVGRRYRDVYERAVAARAS
jgi:glycosyltransferase involved in cell wall biosynthesis